MLGRPDKVPGGCEGGFACVKGARFACILWQSPADAHLTSGLWARASPADAGDARFARPVWLMLVMLDLLAACVKAQPGGCSRCSLCLRPMGKGSLADARDARFACGLCQGSAPADAHAARFACVLWERAVWLMLVMLDLLAACVKAQPG